MKHALLIALPFIFVAATAQADTANVRQGHAQLRPVATSSASGGSTAARGAWSEREAMFRSLDYDGDGFVSKAEAAGNAFATLGFDRADRNRDGKLTFSEYENAGKKPQAKNTERRPRTTARTERPAASSAGTSSASKP